MHFCVVSIIDWTGLKNIPDHHIIFCLVLCFVFCISFPERTFKSKVWQAHMECFISLSQLILNKLTFAHINVSFTDISSLFFLQCWCLSECQMAQEKKWWCWYWFQQNSFQAMQNQALPPVLLTYQILLRDRLFKIDIGILVSLSGMRSAFFISKSGHVKRSGE